MSESLAAKLALVARDCRYVQKEGFNSFHKYKFASAADVAAKVNEAMANHGVSSTVEAELLSETVENGNRTATVKVTASLRCGGSGEVFTTSGIGCGQDKGDKAVMKAQTAALKYAWLMAFNIEMGDDPEADESTDRRAAEPPPRPQAPTPIRTAPPPAAAPIVDPSATRRETQRPDGPTVHGTPIRATDPDEPAIVTEFAEKPPSELRVKAMREWERLVGEIEKVRGVRTKAIPGENGADVFPESAAVAQIEARIKEVREKFTAWKNAQASQQQAG